MFVAPVKYIIDSVAVIYFLLVDELDVRILLNPSWYLSSLTKFGVSDFWGSPFMYTTI
jgi:hypothetical protein